MRRREAERRGVGEAIQPRAALEPRRDDRLDAPGAPPLAEPDRLALRDEMLLLHQRLDVLLPDRPRRVIHFTAARRGEGTSTIVRAYGRALADGLGRSVLIVDANESHPDQHLHFEVTAQAGWNDLVTGGAAVERAIYPTGHPNLSLSPLSHGGAPLPSVADGPTVARLFARLREEFDTILVDSSPVFRSGAMVIAGKADGVVLVLEAERTRWPVALKAKDAVQRSGGSVLGVVLNKRRHHIPDAIYRWL